jgi:hypothetical protein
MNVESSTPRRVGRPRRGGAAEAPSTAVRRGGDRARRGGGRATGSRSRCDGGAARGVVPRVAAARSRHIVYEAAPWRTRTQLAHRAEQSCEHVSNAWAVRIGPGISKIDFLGDRRALRRAFCVRARRAGPAKAQRERYDAATRVSPLNPMPRQKCPEDNNDLAAVTY